MIIQSLPQRDIERQEHNRTVFLMQARICRLERELAAMSRVAKHNGKLAIAWMDECERLRNKLDETEQLRRTCAAIGC